MSVITLLLCSSFLSNHSSRCVYLKISRDILISADDKANRNCQKQVNLIIERLALYETDGYRSLAGSVVEFVPAT